MFANSEPDKVKAINELLGSTPEEEIEKNSMNRLQNKELSEVLTAHFGRKISEEEVQKLLEDMNEQELEELKEETDRKIPDQSDLQIIEQTGNTYKLEVNSVMEVLSNLEKQGVQVKNITQIHKTLEDVYNEFIQEASL